MTQAYVYYKRKCTRAHSGLEFQRDFFFFTFYGRRPIIIRAQYIALARKLYGNKYLAQLPYVNTIDTAYSVLSSRPKYLYGPQRFWPSPSYCNTPLNVFIFMFCRRTLIVIGPNSRKRAIFLNLE